MTQAECTLTDEQLIDAVEKWVMKLNKTAGRSWVMNVPMEYNKDPDVLICEVIRRFKKLKQSEQL